MEMSQRLETEELMTCVQILFYHPQQASRAPYRLLPLDTRHKHQAEDPLRLGRDGQHCTFALHDSKVSRKQLALQAYRSARSPEILFTVQNLSQKARLTVNGSVLGYLERTDLPDKAIVRFAEYEVLICRDVGEAIGSYEVEFGVLTVPPSRETGMGVPSMTPVMDTGYANTGLLVTNGFPADLMSRGPLEMDETIMCQ